MPKFAKYKLGQTNLFAPGGVLSQNGPDGKAIHLTEKDLTNVGVPKEEIERHIELGTIVGLEGTEIEESEEEPEKPLTAAEKKAQAKAAKVEEPEKPGDNPLDELS